MMRVFTAKLPDGIEVRALADDTGMIGDFVRVLKPGDNCLGYPYAWWEALPDGRHDVEAFA